MDKNQQSLYLAIVAIVAVVAVAILLLNSGATGKGYSISKPEKFGFPSVSEKPIFTTDVGVVKDSEIKEIEVGEECRANWQCPSDFYCFNGICKEDEVCVNPPSGLIGWWPGENNPDDISDGNNGVLNNGATFATGVVDQAFFLDGIDDFVRISDAPNLDLSSVTIDAWIRPNRINVFQRIVSKGASYDLFIDNTGRLRCIVAPLSHGPGTSVDIPTPQSNFPTGIWSHVACTYNEIDGKGKVYLNGQQVGVTLDLADNNPLVPNNLDLLIGNRVGNNQMLLSSYFDGFIDEVEIFDRPLTQPEIEAIYTAGSAGKCKNPVICGDGICHPQENDEYSKDWCAKDCGVIS